MSTGNHCNKGMVFLQGEIIGVIEVKDSSSIRVIPKCILLADFNDNQPLQEIHIFMHYGKKRIIWYDEKEWGAWENEKGEAKSSMGERNKPWVKWRVVDTLPKGKRKGDKIEGNIRNSSRSAYSLCSWLEAAICGPEKELLQILIFDISFAVAPKLQWDKYSLLQNIWEKIGSYLQVFPLFSSSPHVGLNVVISVPRSLISNLGHNCSSITDFSKSLQVWRDWREEDQAMWKSR